MSALRSLQLESVRQVMDDVTHLRRGFRQGGNWTLAQICWHVGKPIELMLAPPVPMDLAPTTEQAAIKAGFVDYIVKHKQPPPSSKESPPQFIPPAEAGDADIDRYLESLYQLQTYQHPQVMAGPFGPITIDEFRKVNIYHAAHHLAFLASSTLRRVGLNYKTIDDAVADIRTLQRGYSRAGNWSLEQICWHINATTVARLRPGPFPPDTDDQKSRASVLAQVLATGQLPAGLVAPDNLTAPADVGPSAVDECLATFARLKNYTGPISPHRLFGALSDSDARKLILIHASHHLSHLVPSDK